VWGVRAKRGQFWISIFGFGCGQRPALGISINQLSRDLSVPPNRISEIVSGRRGITADTALRLQRYFGVEAQFWLNLQTEYDLRIMKRKVWADIERRITPIKETRIGSEHTAGA
jgi:addiction module HigA family antidote